MAKSRRLRTARQEQQPWHASTAAQEMPVMSKVEQMQATPARGEPDKLAIEARKTGFDEIYLPFRADQAGKPRAALSAASTAFVNGPARCITIYRSGLNW